ncbi:MAG TPA: DegT/DnrJ/EryC1/StrS family aminotransferase [Solirubrobacteraceae bacterium]|nr:DegT/DnrJ/EryC1/StrS family aminotransferase [Solirubrobacteraceae bacterium]
MLVSSTTPIRGAHIPRASTALDTVTLGTFEATPAARRYVDDVLTTGRLSYGPYSRRFEREFAAIHQCASAVVSSSGTAALQVALQAMKELDGWADGDEVIVPAVTFVATANIVLHNNLRPVLVDVEPDFYGLAPAAFAAAITPRTRAVIPVHLFGQPCDMTAIMAIARRHGLRVLEDSCETMFARHAGRMCGSFGDAAAFSTYIAHLIVTGVGGLTTTSDADLAAVTRSLINHGRDGIYISIDDTGSSRVEREMIVDRRFRFDRVGHSARITELEAALGVAALETWEEMVATRRAHAAYLTARLSEVRDRIQIPARRPETDHSFMMFPLVLHHEPKRELVQHLESTGIETRDMLPILTQPVYRDGSLLDVTPGRHPTAEWIDRSGFYVDCHQGLSPEQLEHLADTIIAWCRTAPLGR